MSRYTKERREEIVRDFATRHNGLYDPALFLAEVQDVGADHPAYDWFEWDTDKAARLYQLEQARDFIRGLKVSFKVDDVTPSHQIKVREQPIPMFISPVEGRKSGGGYLLTNPEDPEHMAEHCRQAAQALTQWRDRYSAAMAYVGVSDGDVTSILIKLEKVSVAVMAA